MSFISMNFSATSGALLRGLPKVAALG